MSVADDYAIETSGLSRRFDFVAVDGITLQIPKGHLYGFLGLNGAGKTTTIRMLTTLLPPSAGTAKLWGLDVAKEPLVRRLVGLVSDETSESQSTWTAREYLTYFSRIRRLSKAREEVERILDDVGLDARFRDKLIGTYSTGMKRRVEIARADGWSESAVSGRAHAGARPSRQTRHVEVAASSGGGRESYDVPEQPRRAGGSQPVRRNQRDREGPRCLHGRDWRTRNGSRHL